MKLSSGKINHLTSVIMKSLFANKHIEIFAENEILRNKIKTEIILELRQEDAIDEQIRQRLNSYSRKIQEGSREWDIMYGKEFEDILRSRLQKILGHAGLEQ
jgi:uncharacterized protein